MLSAQLPSNSGTAFACLPLLPCPVKEQNFKTAPVGAASQPCKSPRSVRDSLQQQHNKWSSICTAHLAEPICASLLQGKLDGESSSGKRITTNFASESASLHCFPRLQRTKLYCLLYSFYYPTSDFLRQFHLHHSSIILHIFQN